MNTIPLLIPRHIAANPISRKIWSGMHYTDKSFFGVMIGDTGIGKSGSAISLSYDWDCDKNGKRRFVIRCDSDGNPSYDTRIVYKMSDFLRFATDAQQKLPKGSFVIWDEAGVENDNTQWFSLKNRITKYVMQTNRYLNRGVFLTVPDLESITIASKRLLHWVFNVQDRNENFASVEPHLVTRDRIYKMKTYYPFPTYTDNYGLRHQLVSLNVARPVPELELPYKKIKEKATQDWYKGFDTELAKMKEFAQKENITADIDAKLEGMDKKGNKEDAVTVSNYVLSNLDEFGFEAGQKKMTENIIAFRYAKKGIILKRQTIKDALAEINSVLKKQNAG